MVRERKQLIHVQCLKCECSIKSYFADSKHNIKLINKKVFLIFIYNKYIHLFFHSERLGMNIYNVTNLKI